MSSQFGIDALTTDYETEELLTSEDPCDFPSSESLLVRNKIEKETQKRVDLLNRRRNILTRTKKHLQD